MAASPFAEHVRHALDSLPPEIARRLENVAVVIEDEHPDDPDLLGLFEEEPYMPAKVTIYPGISRPSGIAASGRQRPSAGHAESRAATSVAQAK